MLPDPKNRDKDLVVFLDEAQAAGTSEEAQERCAVAALARVAGHRNMQRVLPQAYQLAWGWCVQQASDPSKPRVLVDHCVAAVLCIGCFWLHCVACGRALWTLL